MNPKLAAYEESPTRIDIYIAALLQGAVERGNLNMRWDDKVTEDDIEVIQRIIALAVAVDGMRNYECECEANK
jgi:hypothetical protein